MEQKKIFYDYSAEKNQLLINQRGISFEDIIAAIHEGSVIDVLPHPNQMKYPNQRIYVIHVSDYIYLVPFVEKDESSVFLKNYFSTSQINETIFKRRTP